MSYHTITNLIASYAFAVDSGDFAELGRIFAHSDLTLNGGETVHGSAAVEELAGRVLQTHDDGTLATRHATTNLWIDIDEAGGSARSRSYFTVFQGLADFPLQPIAAGHYRDRFERVDGVWRFAERFVNTDFVGDVSRHVR